MRVKRAIVASQNRDASRDAPRSLAAQKTLARDDKAPNKKCGPMVAACLFSLYFYYLKPDGVDVTRFPRKFSL